MNYKLELEFNKLPATPNKLLGAHWTARSKSSRAWRSLIHYSVRMSQKLPEVPLKFAHLLLTRHSSFEPDHDGLVGSFKPIIDALVHSGVLENDKTSNISAEYRWVKTKPKCGKVTILVTAP